MTGEADGRRRRVNPPGHTAGYSGTPLAKKLGITAACTVLCIDAPAEYRSPLAPIPDGVTLTTRTATDEVALPIGYVDVKVCAVSEVWSGLKVVVRKESRQDTARTVNR